MGEKDGVEEERRKDKKKTGRLGEKGNERRENEGKVKGC